MSFQVDHLPEEVGRRLKQFYRRKRLYSFARVVMWTLLTAGVLALVAMHIDRFAFLSRTSRYVLTFGTYGVAAGVGLFLLGRFFLDRPGPRDIAYELEGKLSPEVEERIVSLEDLLRHPEDSVQDDVGEQLLEDLREATITESGDIHAASLVTDRRAKYLFRACLGLVLLFGLFFLPDVYEFDLMVKRFAQPGRSLPKPSFVKLSVSPDDVVRGKGGEVTLQAETKGNMPQPLKWIVRQFGGYSEKCLIAMQGPDRDHFRFADARKSEMSRVHRTLFLHSVTNLQKTFRYRIRYADAQTEIRSVRVVKQPEVTDLKLTVFPPEYTGQGPKEIDQPGEGASVLKGSDVQLSFRTDRPVAKRQLLFERRDEPVELEVDGKGEPARHRFSVTEKVSIKIHVVDGDGFENVEKPSLNIVPRQDQKPTVQMQYPSGRLKKVPGGIVPMKARIQDDIEIKDVTLQYFMNPDRRETATAKEQDVSLEGKENARELTVTPELDLGKTGAVPGDQILVRIRARDVGGNDGVSRKIFVDVVPFTRGANERRRIQALNFLHQSLQLLAKPGESARKGFSIDPDRYAKIQKLAETHGVPLRETPSVRSLLTALEKEHHFTDQARYKDDVRRIHGILFAACEKSREADGGAEVRRKAFGRLAESILPGLILYRHVKNMTWRFFGMRYEAVRIENSLDALAEQDSPSPQEKRAVTRRAELYLNSLMDLGNELIELSRRTDLIEEDRVKPNVGELNTAGYRLRSGGSLAVRAKSAEDVKSKITGLLNSGRTVLPELQKRDVTARDTLRSMYRSSLGDLDDLPAQWLEADAGMLHRNPFAPVWPQYLRFALSTTPVDATEQLNTLHDRILRPPSKQPRGLRHVSRRLARLAFQMQAKEVRARDEVSSVEKALQLRLLRIEWASLLDGSNEERIAGYRKEVGELELGTSVPESDLNELSETFRPSGDRESTHLESVREQVRETGELPDPTDQIRTLINTMETAGEKLGSMIGTLQNAGSEQLRKKLEELVGLMTREKQLMQSVARGLWLRFAIHVPPQEEAGPRERLMLKIRRLTEQYISRVGRPMAQLRRLLNSTEADQLKRAQLQAKIQDVRASHTAYRKQLREMSEAGAGVEKKKTSDDRKFLLLEDFRQTREYVRVTRRLTDGEGRAKLARKFIRAFPEAGLAYLSDNIGQVHDARSKLQEARTILEKDRPDLEAFGSALSAVKAHVSGFQDVVSSSGSGDVQARIQSQLQKLANRIDKIEPEELGSDREVKSALFELSEAGELLKRVLGEVRAITRRSRTAGPDFEGGPAGIRGEAHRRDAEFTRERLERRSQRARGFVTAGVLEALRTNPDERRYDVARDWSLFLYRLVRSELAGVGSVVREDIAGGKEENPHLKFLRAELQEALKAEDIPYYQDVTGAYLRAVQDYLKY